MSTAQPRGMTLAKTIARAPGMTPRRVAGWTGAVSKSLIGGDGVIGKGPEAPSAGGAGDIGKTKSGASVYAKHPPTHSAYSNFSKQDHHDAAMVHSGAASRASGASAAFHNKAKTAFLSRKQGLGDKHMGQAMNHAHSMGLHTALYHAHMNLAT